MGFPLLHEKSGAIATLVADRLAVRQNTKNSNFMDLITRIFMEISSIIIALATNAFS